MIDYPYIIHTIDEHTWMLEDCIEAYSYLLEGENKAMLIDTGDGFGDLRAVVESLTDKPVFVVNSHGHFDHIGCNYQFDTVYITAEDEVVLKEHSSHAVRESTCVRLAGERNLQFTQDELDMFYRLPQTKALNYIKDGDRFDLGGRIIEIIATPGHTPGSVCFLEANKHRLYSADTVCTWGILLHIEPAETVRTYRDSILKLESRQTEFDLIYPGHHVFPIDTSYLEDYRICADNIISGKEMGKPFEDLFGGGYQAKYNRIVIDYIKEKII